MTSPMVNTPAQISQTLLLKLSVSDPALSLEIGTPERKIIDACAEAISESTIDNYLLGSSLDIDTKSGTDLENFVGIFGFARQAGRYSVGNVNFTLPFPATTPITIPIGTQTYAPAAVTGTTDLYFSTTLISTIPTGVQTTTIPVQCTLIGSVGNVPSTTVTGFVGGFGIGSVTNSSPMTAGLDPETDDQLRARFKATFLRNLAGTEAFYSALMLQSTYTSQVKVIGPYSYYKEELQFFPGYDIRSTNPNIKYTWPLGWYLYVDQGLPTEVFYVNGVDFIVDTTVNPTRVVPVNPALTAYGATADFEYQYTTLTSRNDPVNGVSNKVDIFINGSQTADVSEAIVCSSVTFTNSPSSIYYTNNFKRADRTSVSNGHRFQPLGSVPVVSFPNVIYSPTNTYIGGVDFIGVNCTTLNRGSNKELSGIEWLTSSPPATGLLLTLGYTYNRLPEIMQSLINAQKQITTDVMVHQAEYLYLHVTVVVVYDFYASVANTNAAIATALTGFFTNSGFGAWVQYSDILQTVHNVSGVDNVRMGVSNDGVSPYGLASRFNGVVQTQYTNDFRVPDDVLCIYDGVSIIRRSQNTF